MFCKKCGSELNKSDVFCSNCGVQVENESSVNALSENVVSTNEEIPVEEKKSFFRELLTSSGRFGRWRYVKNFVALVAIEKLVIYCLNFSIFFAWIIFFLFLYAKVNLIAKRLHDLGYSSLYSYFYGILRLLIAVQWLALTSIGGGIFNFAIDVIALCLVFIKGNKGANKYGSDPLED